ncbi:cytochrome P450 [Teratosphaeria nubilosa]|uniref:Cytochrome P450 n=1 Tax=Teratosphaeria nubilosa TaxID=161662 RepID=A0A6G1L7C1_9PEZI|nr:cytochrome P450 [Teratosphaeria nubilosa]
MTLGQVAVALVLAAIAYAVYQLRFSRLSAFPGPFGSQVTDIPRAVAAATGRVDDIHRQWHKKYGTAVRIGPNAISISDPNLIKVIYATKNAWTKSDMYEPNDVLIGKQRMPNMFNTRDNAWHDKIMRPIRGFWSMTKVLEIEPYIDQTLNLLVEKLDEKYIKAGKTCMMDDWIAYFAWDVTANLTFGRHYGFIERETDVDNLIVDSTKGLYYFAPISQMPWLDNLLDKNPVYRIGPKPTLTGVMYAFGVVAQYQKDIKEKGPPQGDHVDHYLDKYLALREEFPDMVDDNQIVNWLMLNILAGGDTTSAMMRAVVYYLAKTPGNYRKLVDELDEVKLSLPAQWKDVQGLPYLDAVIREASRYNPGIAMIFERDVPEPGFSLPDGRFIPGGTKVGINPAVTNRDLEIFGPDADGWDADRWLQKEGESKEEFAQRVQRMKDVSEFTFGAGNRVCMGKNLAKLEIYKLIATLYSLYDIKLVDPEHKWKYHDAWFVYQWDMPMILSRRSRS